VALGLGLLDIKRIRIAALLPSLVLVVAFYYLGRLFV